MSGEVWRPAGGFEGFYEVSDLGRVKRIAGSPRCKVDRILNPMLNPRGYLVVGLTRPGIKQNPCLTTLMA